MADAVQPPCQNCASTGFCPRCKGDGLVLVQFVTDICMTCHGSRRMGMSWCQGCGGSGRQLLYEALVQCEECIGDGSCVTCGGKGSAEA